MKKKVLKTRIRGLEELLKTLYRVISDQRQTIAEQKQIIEQLRHTK